MPSPSDRNVGSTFQAGRRLAARVRAGSRRTLRAFVRWAADAAPGAPQPERAGRTVRRFARSRSGAAAVEFALVALPFFAILFSLVETGLVFIGDTTMQNAVKQAAREVRTGQVAGGDFDLPAFREALCEYSVFFDCSKFKIDLKAYASYSDIPLFTPIKDGELDESGFGYTAGGANQIMALRVYYEWPIYTDVMSRALSNLKSGSYLMAATVAFRTEPFE